AYDYDLSKPKLTEPKRRSSITPVGKYAFYTEGACHLELVRKGGTKIDYNFGSINEKERVVLLTGANSGGKTTLLETIAQIFIMAQMGLPVCAKECELTPFEELYFFTHKRNLDAGAFESFLKTFIPIACSNTRKLVLADELEAMTELEAASKIIAAFIEMINSTDSYSIIVTHMAGEISKHVDVRIDGIEAKGLDANFNLIVDRTPKIGVYAKSTPELIVMRLYERSNGELKKVYKKLLEKFQNVKKKSD
ncbi:MAG: endonuclease MutS2, partial [Thermoplasmata archaeon]